MICKHCDSWERFNETDCGWCKELGKTPIPKGEDETCSQRCQVNEIIYGSCGECAFFHEVGLLGHGACRRYPPTFGEANWATYPTVERSVGWCGEYTKKEGGE